MDTTFSVDAIKAALSMTSKDETRFHICALAVADGYLAATDGHALLEVRQPGCKVTDTGKETTVIASTVMEPIARMRGAKSVRVNGTIDAKDKDGKVLASLPTPDSLATFPPVETVIPKIDSDYGILRCNPKLLARALDAMARAGCDKVVIRTAPDELSPCHISGETSEGATVTAVVMPMRK